MSNETHQKPATPDKTASYRVETHKFPRDNGAVQLSRLRLEVQGTGYSNLLGLKSDRHI